MMRLYECACGYRFVVSKKYVIGPMMPVPYNGEKLFSAGRFLTRRQFKIEYSDCHANYMKWAKHIYITRSED